VAKKIQPTVIANAKYPDSDITDSLQVQSPSAILPFDMYKISNDKATLEGLYELIVQFSNECNIPQRVLCDLPSFRNIILYVMNNSTSLKRSDPNILTPSWRKFSSIRQGQYERLLAMTAFYLSAAKESYEKLMGKPVPFVTLQHDIWDSDDNEVLGLTLVFYCPKYRYQCRIPIAMVRVISKVAVATVEQTIEALKSVGIGQLDIYRSVNDTTNVAVRVGFLLSGNKGTCNMHTIQLVIEHCTGRRMRKLNKQIIDSFPECEALRKGAKEAASYLVNKKKKSVWKSYAKLMRDEKFHFVKLIVPNDTRAAGVVLMYQSLLRSRFNLKKFYDDYPESVKCTDEMYEKIAEIEAILYPLSVLIKLVQTNKFGSLSYSFVLCFRTYVFYAINEFWYFADVNAVRESRWTAAAKLPKRNWRGVPDDMTCLDEETGPTKMKMKMKPTSELGIISRKLITRVELEFRKYSCSPTGDQLLAIACNPLSIQLGLQELFLMKTLLERSSADAIIKSFAIDFESKAKERLEKEIRKLFSKELEGSLQVEEEVTPTPMHNDIFLTTRKEINSGRPSNKMGDPVKNQINEFFSHQVRWHHVLAEQQVNEDIIDQIGKTTEEYQENWHLIAQHFNVMAWWESDGKKDWPYIYGVACLILPMPESNGGQERTFSTATWMDGKLNKRQSEATFQMKVVLHQNAEFLQGTKMHMEQIYKQQAQQATRALFELSDKWKNERENQLSVEKAKATKIDYYFKHKVIRPEAPTLGGASDHSVPSGDRVDTNESELSEKQLIEQLEVLTFLDSGTDVSKEEYEQRKAFGIDSDSDTD
jgi:hypothetical protein